MTTSAQPGQLTCEEVNRRLKALGFESGPDQKLSHCAREAIRRGHIKLKGEDKKELEQVIFTDKFPDYQCGHKGDFLFKPDQPKFKKLSKFQML